MSSREIRIATRKSALALWQAEYVKARLEEAHPGLLVTLVPMVSRGDKLLDSPLSKIGGKGLFVKELETARCLRLQYLCQPGRIAVRQHRRHLQPAPSGAVADPSSGPGNPLPAR